MIGVLFDYAILIVGIFALLGLIWTGLRYGTENEDTDTRRVGILFIIIAYVLSELVPSRFVTVSGTVDTALGVLTIALLIVGVVLAFRRT